VVAGRDDLMQRYFEALAVELDTLGNRRVVDTIYVGGGTPTELGPEALRQLLELLDKWFVLGEDYEYTVEANPDAFPATSADLLAGQGVNRVSLGVQSFAASKLRSLDRQHTAAESFRAFELARTRFANISIDLIFAAPGENLITWQQDLRTAIGLSPHHISTYGLTFEKGTLFWNALRKGRVEEVNDSIQGDMYEMAIDQLVLAGFEHYEVSNFARPGLRSRHNQIYWTGKPFWAFGPGAANYLDGRRAVNHRSTSTYLRRLLAGQSPVDSAEELAPEEAARERLIFGLRRLEGISLSQFQCETGFAAEELAGETIREFVASGYLERESDCLRLTRRGLLVSDSLWPALL